ncbi:hypothetical protein SAMN05216503_0331 [Polaribacter sp. KT25b]|uniref:Spy/CpxP family protein refolding chaperone n=1 Tax=Polaribacter sp. KT25b TaxID=1855336 RepID=UPI00087DF127|nr:hypothetical protein [Polaribacter sp. KT25b]SDR67829.1 hypothetical protein SAMN05216503_0331 [Polaribacter sp. KT25b]
MKKIVTILILVFAFTLTAEAQKKEGKNPVDRMLSKMTTDLNLTTEQQNKIKPLIEEQIADRKAMTDLRKMQGESGVKPTQEDRKKMREDRMAKEASMDAKMASILDAEQLEKYNLQKEELKGRRGQNRKKKDNE